VLLDYKKNGIVRTYPLIPGGEPSNYPNSGSSVSLFLKPPYTKAEVLDCGGSPLDSYAQTKKHWYNKKIQL
jgi:Glyoxal oxidase N-terminus